MRNMAAGIALQVSASNLNKSVAAKSMSESFMLELSSEFSIQPLFSSQDWASIAKETRLGEAVICASRSAWDEKSRVLCGDVVFWLLWTPHEGAQDPVFCLKESPMLSDDQAGRVCWRERAEGMDWQGLKGIGLR